ncbi:hypothetical protein [Nitrospira sp. Nam80]
MAVSRPRWFHENVCDARDHAAFTSYNNPKGQWRRFKAQSAPESGGDYKGNLADDDQRKDLTARFQLMPPAERRRAAEHPTVHEW